VSEILVVKDYINEFLKLKIISIWIIYIYFLKTHVSILFIKNEPP